MVVLVPACSEPHSYLGGLAVVLWFPAKQDRSKRTEVGPDTKKALVLIQFADHSAWGREGEERGGALCLASGP